MSTSAAPVTQDPADAAGGNGDEVVYSSDAVDVIEIVKPPIITQANLNNQFTLDSESVSPSQAFEVFAGKLYSHSSNSNNYMLNSGEKEAPLQKLARLQAEIAQLESELNAAASTSAGDGDAGEPASKLDQEILKATKQLQDRLTAAQSTRVPAQDELTRLIQQQMNQMSTASKNQDSQDSAAQAASSVVYELYATQSNNSKGNTSAEDRLTKLEQLLGSSAGATNLLQRLEQLESLSESLHDKSLEQAATKAKLIRADLEAASKARNKVVATYKQQDSQTIQNLHELSQELEGIHTHLPILSERLQQLHQLHHQSASFAARLSESEEQALACQAYLAQCEATFRNLEQQMVENVQVVQQNVKALDERIQKLG
jgi:hypothetical protein